MCQFIYDVNHDDSSHVAAKKTQIWHFSKAIGSES